MAFCCVGEQVVGSGPGVHTKRRVGWLTRWVGWFSARAVLGTMDDLFSTPGRLARPDLVELAVFFHDAVSAERLRTA
jgi:hypothetical protein